MGELKIYKISKDSYESTRDFKLFSFMWNPIKYKIYNFKKLGTINDKYIQKGTLLKNPHIQMILQVQNKINETMKHIKLYENFVNEELDLSKFKFKRIEDEAHYKGIYPKRKFKEITEPKDPIKRKLSDEETAFMYRNFPNNSWSKIDALGRIILGGSESSFNGGMYYITEDDLNAFMEEEKAHE